MKGSKKLRVLWNILRHTNADKVLSSYLLFVFIDAALLWILEPSITTYRDALWYCYAVVSTAGFGDVVVSGLIPKILSVLLTVYSLLVIAIVTGVVVNFYTQMMEARNRESIVSFLDELERLPELSEEERKDLSERVKRFRNSR